MSSEDSVFLLSVELTSKCPLNCPFCYFKRRFRGEKVFTEARNLACDAKSVFGRNEFAIVFGGGEPLTTPALLGKSMKDVVEEGSAYTSFTSNGVLLTNTSAEKIESYFGRSLRKPYALANFGIDEYKLVASPRAREGRVERKLLLAWRILAETGWTRRVAEKWGVNPEYASKPPALLEAVTVAEKRKWSIGFNVLLSENLLETLNPLGAGVEFFYTLFSLADQIQFLAPKPLKPLLPLEAREENGETVFEGKALAEIYALLPFWASVTETYVDQALQRILGFPSLEKGFFCAAGRRMVSADPEGKMGMCSFAPHSEKWRPGTLGDIVTKLSQQTPRTRCPYL